MKCKFVLEGLTPLIPHNGDVELTDELTRWRKDNKNKNVSRPGDDRSPPWTWQTYLYNDGVDVCVPAMNVWTSFRNAATSKSMKGQKSFKESAAAGLYIEEEFIPIEIDSDNKIVKWADIVAMRDESFNEQMARVKKKGFQLFTKRVSVNKNKHLRVRPLFKSWRLRGTLIVSVPEIDLETLRDIGDIAGRYKGLCDGRPGSKSPWPYGVFSASFEEIAA